MTTSAYNLNQQLPCREWTVSDLSLAVVHHACHCAGSARTSRTEVGIVCYLCHVNSQTHHSHRACIHHHRRAVLLEHRRRHHQCCLSVHRTSGHLGPSSAICGLHPMLAASRWQMVLQPHTLITAGTFSALTKLNSDLLCPQFVYIKVCGFAILTDRLCTICKYLNCLIHSRHLANVKFTTCPYAW